MHHAGEVKKAIVNDASIGTVFLSESDWKRPPSKNSGRFEKMASSLEQTEELLVGNELIVHRM